MDVLRLPKDVQSCVRQQQQQGQTVAVVPTMGALHDGHLSLIHAARRECDFVITTIFVNPTQFGPDEDYVRYPRDLNADLDLCRSADADLVFAPAVDDMYPADSETVVRVTGISTVLEGQSRPTHFDGVTTIVTKLLNITLPDRAYFGQKDYQQQLIIRRMVEDLNWPTEIVTCPIIREADGLALSSRNRYLSASQREAALILHRTLNRAQEQAAAGAMSPAEIQQAMSDRLDDTDDVEPDYAVVADPQTLQPADDQSTAAVALLAARVGSTRLIDNAMLTFAEGR